MCAFAGNQASADTSPLTNIRVFFNDFRNHFLVCRVHARRIHDIAFVNMITISECYRKNGWCEMPKFSLPAASLQSANRLPAEANRLPAGRVGKRVSIRLICIVLWTMRSPISGAGSIFLPAFPVRQGRGSRRALREMGERAFARRPRRIVSRRSVR